MPETMNYRRLFHYFIYFLLIVISSQQPNNGYIQISAGSRKFDTKISTHDLKKSVNFAKDTVDRLHRLEKSLNWSDVKVKYGTIEHANFLQGVPDSKALEQGKNAYVTTHATIHLKHKYCRRFGFSDEECMDFLGAHKLHETKLFPSCLEKSKICFDVDIYAKYRTITGACNHPYDGIIGESKTSYKRLVNPEYLDGIHRIRNSVTRSKLPPARKITSKLFKNEDDPEEDKTLILMEWSQFILHDLSHTVTRKMVHTREKIVCCTQDGSNLSPRHEHPFCLPIEIPDDDEFYSKFNIKCLSYVRSLPAIKNDCSFGALEQFNQATHYLDASQIYGNDPTTSDGLRTFKDGLLDFQIIDDEIFPPYFTNKENCMNFKRDKCFKGADSRLNSEPLLTTLHTIFLREHNRIAKILKEINPRWTDDILYEESRRIVIGELQHVTYNEWLPVILGENHRFISSHKTDDFQPLIDPRITNSFATAAMSFIKSLFDSNVKFYDNNRAVNITLKLKDIYRRSSMIINRLDQFLVTLSTQNVQKMDLNVPDDVKNQLFSNGHYGLDLISLDIQRGRDHGLAGYLTYRKLCGLGEINDFDDLSPIIPEKTVEILARLYKDPRDIDLVVGGLSETSLKGGILGPTFSCIVTDQFLRTKHGDRYFYSHIDQPKPFTNGQLREIQKVTLASIFCANGNVEMLQRDVFKTADERNRLEDCGEIPQINFGYWRQSI